MKIKFIYCDMAEDDNSVTIGVKNIFGSKIFVSQIKDLQKYVLRKANKYCLKNYNCSLKEYVAGSWDDYKRFSYDCRSSDLEHDIQYENLKKMYEEKLMEDFLNDPLNQPPEIVPVEDLPEGWSWINYMDGSGCLESPDGKDYFSFDITTNEGKDINDVWQFFDDISLWKKERVGEIKKYLKDGFPSKYVCPENIPATDETINLCGLDYKAICKKLYENYKNLSNSSIIFSSDSDVLKIEAYVYEPHYECFDLTHAIYLNDELLWGKRDRNTGPYHNEEYVVGKFKNDDEIEVVNFLNNYFKGKTLTEIIS